MNAPKPQKTQYGAPYRNIDEHSASSSSTMNIIALDPVETVEDNDDNPLPPPYSEHENAPLLPVPSSREVVLPVISVTRMPPEDLDAVIEEWTNYNSRGGHYIRLSHALSIDPEALQRYIEYYAAQPPRAYVRICGTHIERREHDSGGKKSSRTERVEDFDFQIDVSRTFSHGTRPAWNTLECVWNETKTYRGTRLKHRMRNKAVNGIDERAIDIPGLKEWCHLFCASSAPLKSFTLRRRIINRDEKLLAELLTAALRSTGYRGNIDITFPLYNRSLTIGSPHQLNRLRLNPWVWWFVVLLQLWILTWPVLFLMTKRWETVAAKWAYASTSRGTESDGVEYWQESERAWVARWSFAVQQAALSRTRGGTEIQRAVTEEEDRLRSERERAIEPRGGFADGVLALARGLSNARRDMQQSIGWGYDMR